MTFLGTHVKISIYVYIKDCLMAIKNREQGRKRSVLVMLFLSYAIIMAIAVLTNYIYFLQVDRNAQKGAEITRDAVLTQYAETFAARMTEISRLSNSILFLPELDGIVRQVPEEDIAGFQQNLLKLKPDNPFIIDYFVYLRDQNLVITPTSRMQAKAFYNSFYNYNDMSFNDWQTELNYNYYFNLYMPAKDMTVFGTGEKSVITYIQSAPLNIKNIPAAQIIVLLDAEKMQASLVNMAEAASSAVYTVGKDNSVIFASPGAPPLGDDIKAIITGDKKAEYVESADMMVDVKTFSGDYKVVATTERSVYYKMRNEVRVSFLWQLAIMMVVGFGLSIWFTSRNYAPIREISDMVGSGKGNEYDGIKKAISQNIEKQKQLSAALSSHRAELRTAFFQRRLSGTEVVDLSGGADREQQLEAELASLGIATVSNIFTVVVVRIFAKSPFFEEEEKQPDLNLATARLVIQNIGEEVLSDAGVQNFYVGLDKDLAAFVINLEPGAEELLNESFDTIEKHIWEHFRIKYFAGVGGLHSGLGSIYQSVDEAKKALEYSEMNENFGLTRFNNVVDLEYDYFYPSDIETQISNLLRVGDEEQVYQIIETIFDINFNQKKISPAAGKYLVVEISGTMVKVMNSLLAREDEPLVSSENVLKSLGEGASFETLKKDLLGFAGEVCKKGHRRQFNQTERLVGRIEKYVLSSEEWLDLATIAAKFDITPQYLSTIFKKYTSENIKEFISKMRLEKAKKILCETGLTVDEVAVKLGYANETGLNRLFKKYEGITPGAYRSSRQAAKNEKKN